MSTPNSAPDALVERYASEILKANEHWAKRLNQTFPEYFPPPGKQAPKILWIGCSDSRVQESDATTSLPGTVFVHRNIANQVHVHDDNALSVLTYSLGALEVQHAIVVGHEHCGGVVHALSSLVGPLPAEMKRNLTLQDPFCHSIESPNEGCHLDNSHSEQSKKPNDVIDRWLTPLIKHLQELLDKGLLPDDPDEAVKFAVRENVRLQVDNLTGRLEGFVKESTKKKVWVHGWVYNFSTGFIEDLKITKQIN